MLFLHLRFHSFWLPPRPPLPPTSTIPLGSKQSVPPPSSLVAPLRNLSHHYDDMVTDASLDAHSDAKQSDAVHNPDPSSNADPAKPLAPPPRPGQQQGPTGNTPDYFNGNVSADGGSLSLEPNPFEQSFSGGGAPETPGGTKLPSVAALTSPSSLLPGTGVTPFAWGGGSLRTGPLSPAMLSAPTTDYFSDTHHIRGGFPTPNESSLRTGLTPGGSGSMFPAASPNTQAMFGQLTGSGATPGTIDFHRAAINAAAAKREQQQQALAQAPPSVTSQPQELSTAVAPATVKIETNKPASGPFDPHDNDAANGLFMLAQGRSTQPPNPPYTMAPQQQVHAHPMAPVSVAAPTITAAPIHASPVMKGNTSSRASGSARGMSEVGSIGSDDSEPPRPNTRGKGKRNSTSTATTNGRRKAEEAPGKAPASKKAKTNGASISMHDMEELSDDDDDDDMGGDDMGPKGKMTDEEKRKNFLERNRYECFFPTA